LHGIVAANKLMLTDAILGRTGSAGSKADRSYAGREFSKPDFSEIALPLEISEQPVALLECQCDKRTLIHPEKDTSESSARK
jgi:hypothetical protein